MYTNQLVCVSVLTVELSTRLHRDRTRKTPTVEAHGRHKGSTCFLKIGPKQRLPSDGASPRVTIHQHFHYTRRSVPKYFRRKCRMSFKTFKESRTFPMTSSYMPKQKNSTCESYEKYSIDWKTITSLSTKTNASLANQKLSSSDTLCQSRALMQIQEKYSPLWMLDHPRMPRSYTAYLVCLNMWRDSYWTTATLWLHYNVWFAKQSDGDGKKSNNQPLLHWNPNWKGQVHSATMTRTDRTCQSWRG